MQLPGSACLQSWLGHFGQSDRWISCLTAAKRPRIRSDHDKARVPPGQWKPLTFIAALRHDRVDAPCVSDGPINADLFTAYAEQVLVPTQARGDIVLLDNLGRHNGQRGRRAIRRAGAHLLFPPPCRPDLNRIAPLFAQLQHRMRAAERRTVEDSWRKVAAILDLVSPNECSNHLAGSGYASAKKQQALGRVDTYRSHRMVAASVTTAR
jgi:transposase